MWSKSFAKIKNISCDKYFLNAVAEEIKNLSGQDDISIWQVNDNQIVYVGDTHLNIEPEFDFNTNPHILFTIQNIQSCVIYNINQETIWPYDNVVKKCAIFPWVYLGNLVALVIITSNTNHQFPNTLEQIPTLLLNTADKMHQSLVNITHHKTNYITYNGIACAPGMNV